MSWNSRPSRGLLEAVISPAACVCMCAKSECMHVDKIPCPLGMCMCALCGRLSRLDWYASGFLGSVCVCVCVSDNDTDTNDALNVRTEARL